MVALIIISCIILLFVFLLSCSIRGEIRFYGNELDIKVKYLFLTLFPIKKRNKKNRKAKKNVDENGEQISDSEAVKEIGKAADTVADAELSAEDRELLGADVTEGKQTLSEKIDEVLEKINKIKIVWESSEKGLKKIFRHIFLDNLVIDFLVTGDDAYEAAMNYGKMNIAVYNAISAVRILFPINVKSVDVLCDFDGHISHYDGEVTVKLGMGTAISAVAVILLGVLKNRKLLFD